MLDTQYVAPALPCPPSPPPQQQFQHLRASPLSAPSELAWCRDAGLLQYPINCDIRIILQSAMQKTFIKIGYFLLDSHPRSPGHGQVTALLIRQPAMYICGLGEVLRCP